MEKIILILLGISMLIFSFPKIRMPIMNRLFNEGVVTPRRVPPEGSEIIKSTGPSISLFAIGVVLVIIGITL